jgi:hypothetical protein
LDGSQEASGMSNLPFAVICGTAFGALAVLLMLPMQFPNKRAALTAAFANRFAIGFVVPLVALPIPGFATGVLIGFLISLSDAVVTRAYGPILGVGTVGGAIIGWLFANAAI